MMVCSDFDADFVLVSHRHIIFLFSSFVYGPIINHNKQKQVNRCIACISNNIVHT